MSNVVIVDAVRTPIGKRNGGLSTLHPAEVLGAVQKAIVERTGIDPAVIDQVIGGCVSQVGEQAFNITRTAWLAAGLPLTPPPPPSTPSAAAASRPPTSASALVGSGVVDVALACGVE
jgi:acetyl-CoA C-acetyltransferase